jgi:hypothetical protein
MIEAEGWDGHSIRYHVEAAANQAAQAADTADDGLEAAQQASEEISSLWAELRDLRAEIAVLRRQGQAGGMVSDADDE